MRAGVRRGLGHVGVGCLFSLLVGFGVSIARAEAPLPLELHWDAPAGCPDAGYLMAAVGRLLEGSPLEGSKVQATAIITRRDDGAWSLALTTTRDGIVGHRSLQADSCAAVVEATALIVALTIDPVHVTPAPLATTSAAAIASAAPSASASAAPSSVASVAPSSPAPPPPAPPATGAPAPRPAPSASSAPAVPTPRSPLPLHFTLGASFAGDVGTLPAAGYGVQGALGLTVSRFRIEAYAAYWPGQTGPTPVTGLTSFSAQVHLAGGGALGCFAVISSLRWQLDPCLGLELGALGATGQGLGAPTGATSLWVAARLEARVDLRVASWFHLAAGIGAAIPFRRDEFVIDDTPGAGTSGVFRPAPASARAWLGPELFF